VLLSLSGGGVLSDVGEVCIVTSLFSDPLAFGASEDIFWHPQNRLSAKIAVAVTQNIFKSFNSTTPKYMPPVFFGRHNYFYMTIYQVMLL
jgi:hypothetical protein